MRDFQLTAALFLCLVSPGPGQAWGKSNLRSDIKHVFFLSANAVHTSNATAANQVSGPTAKLAKKVREQKPKVCFSFLSLDFSLSASSISFERILKCQIKFQPCVHKLRDSFSSFMEAELVLLVYFMSPFLMISPLFLAKHAIFVQLDYLLIWLDGNIFCHESYCCYRHECNSK